MGYAKNRMIEIQERGYGESDKCVCSGCVKDDYLVKIIRKKGEVGACSFCRDENDKQIKHRKVYLLEELMQEIMPAIEYYYLDADSNVLYDSETEKYLGRTIDPYDFVYEVLAEEMQTENMDLLQELLDILEPEVRTSIYEFIDRTSKKDLRAWAKYTNLINERKEMSVEQIV